MDAELSYVDQCFHPDGSPARYVYITYVSASPQRSWQLVDGLDAAISRLQAQGWERLGPEPRVVHMAWEGEVPYKALEQYWFKRRPAERDPQ